MLHRKTESLLFKTLSSDNLESEVPHARGTSVRIRAGYRIGYLVGHLLLSASANEAGPGIVPLN